MKVLCGFVLQNRMDVKNQIAERARFLIKVFSDAPDRAFLYGFAVGKQRTFCQQSYNDSIRTVIVDSAFSSPLSSNETYCPPAIAMAFAM